MTTKVSYKVGGEISSFCTKCKMAHDHIIAAVAEERIAKVQCRTCGGFHRYIDPSAPPKPVVKKATKRKPDQSWEERISSVSSKKKTPYQFAGSFKKNDLIDHVQFGLGVVTERLSWDKIQVSFKEGEKILFSKEM